MKRLIIILLAIITSSICVCGQDIFEPARFFCNRNSTDFYTLNTGNYPTNIKLALRVRQLGSDRFALDFIAAEKVGSGLSSFELQDRRADINSIYGYSIFDTNGKVTSYAFNESNIVTINNYVYKIFSLECSREVMFNYYESGFVFRTIRLYFRDSTGRYETDSDVGKETADVLVENNQGLEDFYYQLRSILF